MTFTTLDLTVLIAYIVGVTAFGILLGGRQKDARDYFLADHAVPWWAIALSVVATETSALTFISIPATAYQADLWILQLAVGYLLGRIAVAVVLLPGYFRGELATAYALLENRFGVSVRRFASSVFMLTRALADSVRIFAAAIPVALITGLPYWAAILATGAFTLLYTYVGGLRAVIWVDVVQMGLYVIGGVVALVVLEGLVPGGWSGIVASLPAEKTRLLHLGGSFADATWLGTGLVGGAFLSMASHGVDHLVVQRLLAAKSLGDARRAVVASGALVIGQFALFLIVGLGLYAFYGGRTFATPDEIFPRFIVEQLPPGLSGLIVAGLLAAAMSTVSSSLNSLASATTHDLYAPLAGPGRGDDPDHLLRVGRRFTMLWAVLLVGGAILFRFASQGTPIVVVALQIASFTYGGLLGGFLLGLLSKRARERDAIVGMSVAIGLMTALWAAQQFGLISKVVDTLWFSLVGAAVTVAAGALAARGRPIGDASGPAPPAPAGAGVDAGSTRTPAEEDDGAAR